MVTVSSIVTAVPLRESISLRNGKCWVPAPDQLLGPYLIQHPLRVKEMLRLVPEAATGIHAHWRLDEGHLELERLQVIDDDDPFQSMVLWYALFPRLRAPLVPWWVSGILRPGAVSRHSKEFKPEIELDQGRVVYFGDERPKTMHWSNAEPHLWPLWVRLICLPVLILATPVLIFFGLRERPRPSGKMIRLILVRLPLLLFLFPLHAFFPKFMAGFIQVVVRPIQGQSGMDQFVDDARVRNWKGRHAFFGPDDQLIL